MELIIPKTEQGTALGGLLLIAGCCIGAGMLGLPVVSALSGFIPSTVAMLLCCLFMMSTGLLVLEATLRFPGEVSLISIAGFTLGGIGKALTWFLFLFIFCCLFVAYCSAGGSLTSELLGIPRELGAILCVAVIGLLIYAGTQVVDFANRAMMAGLVGTYCVLVTVGSQQIHPERLLVADFAASFSAVPILIVSFGFHNLVPTLVTYLKRDVQQLRLTIITGSLMPFFVYLLWNIVILGLLPEDYLAKTTGSNVEIITQLLSMTTGTSLIIGLAQVFSIFAIITSFVTNGLSCIDFLKDGLQMRQERRLLLGSIILLPPLVFSLVYPNVFLAALGLVGGFATVILFGILPVLAVWKGRYRNCDNGQHLVPGGKVSLVVIFLLALAVLGLEIAHQCGGL